MNTGACGSVAGYWRHRRRHEQPCPDCYDAHAEEHAAARIRPGARDPLLYRACLTGREPAEALCAHDRHRLVAELHRLGWDDHVIAVHTRMTTYTTARIRAGLDLLPNRQSNQRGVA